MVALRPAVFLDRDGVLVQTDVRDGKAYAVRTLDEFRLMADAPEATRSLAEMGFALVVVTNQPDVGNGLVDRVVVEAMHRQMAETLPLEAVKTCFHRQNEGCDCRKPKPGMILEAAAELALDLRRSYMVGDRPCDVSCGRDAGCYTIFIDHGYSEALETSPDAVVGSMAEAARHILAHWRGTPR